MYSTRLLILCLFTGIIGYAQTTYKIDEKAIYSWDDPTMDWVQVLTEQYTYGNGGTKETKLVRFSMPGMLNSTQSLKTYNSNNDIVLDNRQFWNLVDMAWNNNSQVIYTYDASNNLTEEVLQVYNTMTMVYDNFSRELYDYTGGNRTKQTSQTWNGTVWENDEQAEISYTGSLPTQVVYSSWNGTTMVWDPYERDTGTYNANDLPAEILEETYNMGSWETSARTVYTYTGLLETQVLYQTWNGSDWDEDDRELTYYDTNDNPNEIIFQEWDTVNMEWDGYYKEERIYSPAAPLSTKSFNLSDVKIYPNPVKDILNLKLKSNASDILQIEVFGIDGRLLKVQKLNNNSLKTEIDLSDVNLDHYLLIIRDRNNGKHVYKLLKT